MVLVGIAFCASCLLSLAMVPAVASSCRARGLVDHPDGHRKLHAHPIALAGGIALFIVVILIAAGGALLSPPLASAFSRTSTFQVGLGLASLVLLLTGVVDDRVGLRGRHKLMGQILACTILMASGLVIHRAQVFGTIIDFGLLSVPLTLVWLLGAINAINLLDGINGLAATVGITAAAALAVMAEMGGHSAEAFVAAALAGGLLGFLRYNFPKATVFLGDAGSMLIGFLIAALSVKSSLKGPGTVLLGAPVCLLAIPFFDSAAAIVRRKLTGRSIFCTDRAHLHHCLTNRFGALSAVLIIGIGCAVSAVAGISAIWWQNDSVALLSAAAVITTFVATRIFGYSELQLLTSRLQALGTSLIRVRPVDARFGKQSVVHLQGSREWNQLWCKLTEAGRALDVQWMELDVNAPSLHEGFHARWASSAPTDTASLWRFDLPLMAVGHNIGHIRIGAQRSSASAVTEMERLLVMLEDFEDQLSEMLRDAERPRDVAIAYGRSEPALRVEVPVGAEGALSG